MLACLRLHRSARRCLLSLLHWPILLCALAGPRFALAAQTLTPLAGQQSTAGSGQNNATVPLTGSVADPSGALIPQAELFFAPAPGPASASLPVRTATDGAGHFSTSLPTGAYHLTVSAAGFTTLQRDILVQVRNKPLQLTLALSAITQQVDVPADTAASTASADNKSALVFSGKALDTLSDDDNLLSKQVLAMAGGSGNSTVYVNGFSGTLPPKDTIREIRINQDPFSTQYPELGEGRVEVFTKPGSDKLNGAYFGAGSTAAFNALNPYTGAEPPYYLDFNRGELSGPLGKKLSFFVSGLRILQQSNAVVNAFNPDGSILSTAVPAPSHTTDLSGRLDGQLGKNNTLSARYDFNRVTQVNSGVGLLVLPSEGATTALDTHVVQLSDTTLFGPNLVLDSRFQYSRASNLQTPNSTAPTIIVQGSFSGGGSPTQASSDLTQNFEFQEYLSVARGNHFLRLGARYVLLDEANTSTANYNGQYTFASLSAYNAGTPNLFSLTAGQPSASLLSGNLGAYAEDEWKVRPDLTVTAGLRVEAQSAVPDHLNPAPRAGFAWSLGQTPKHAPFVVLRGGAGSFYARFAAANLLTSIRQNGISQQSYLVTNPTFYPTLPNPTNLTGMPPTPYTVSPGLRIASENIASLGVERSFGKYGQASVTYYAVRGVHQYNSINLNAPLGNGTRPLGGTADIYQFQSDGIEKAQSVTVNTNLQFGKRVSAFAFYTARRQNSDTFGATSFPSQPFNVSADYGPSGLGGVPVGQRLFANVSLTLPFGFRTNNFVGFFSRSRFDITTGTDRNSDTQFNDRPAFATAPGPASLLYNTAYGVFDANPQPGEAIIPYNYALGPRTVFLATELTREWHFGPRPAAVTPPPGPLKPGEKPPLPDQRYSLRFGVDAENVTNTNNGGPPVGVLSSNFFGRSISLNQSFNWLSAANRILLLSTAFHF